MVMLLALGIAQVSHAQCLDDSNLKLVDLISGLSAYVPKDTVVEEHIIDAHEFYASTYLVYLGDLKIWYC